MKGFTREETRFSLCGLNCRLCSMHLGGYCPGCGGGAAEGSRFAGGVRSTLVPVTTVLTTGTPLCPTGTGSRTSPWPGRWG